MKYCLTLCVGLFALQVHAARLCVFPKLPRQYLRVPIVRQAYEYTCGPAALLSILYYWQVSDQGESALYEILEPHEDDGVVITQLAKGAKTYGLNATFKEDLTFSDLRESLKYGDTVILAIQAWPDKPGRKLKRRKSLKYWKNVWDEGHYVVLIGMDQDYAYFMDPSTPLYYTYIDLEEFDVRWHEEETRGGMWRYQHAGVIIRGKNPIKQQHPHRLIRLR